MSAPKPKKRPNSTARRFHKVVRARRQTYPLHKRILLHPLGTFFVLCVGVFMVGWTYKVIADSTLISTVIEAQPLQTAATIDSPANNSRFASSPITVSGTCPSDSYVQLTLNGTFSGVAWCEANNSYSIVASLYPGVNNLSVQAYNKTDRPGPSADGIQVTYIPPTPQPPAGGTGDNTGTESTPAPLLVSSSFHFQTFTDGQTFKWSIGIAGGKAPYNLYTDWGDSLNSKIIVASAGPVNLQHTYSKPGYYPVVVKVVDSLSYTRVIQLAALITDTHGHATFLGNLNGGNGSSGTTTHLSSSVKWLLLALPSYLIVMLMTMSFWLGERREYLLLRPHRRRHA